MILGICGLLASMVAPLPAPAEESMTLFSVIQTVLQKHPDIALADLQPEILQTEEQRLEGQLDPVISAKVGASNEQTLSTSQFSPSGTTFWELQGNITKPLESGDSVTLGLNYNRTFLDFPPSPFVAALTQLNPAYRNEIDITWRHPLLRGASRPAYAKLLEAAGAEVDASKAKTNVVKEQLALRAIDLFFSIALEQERLETAEVSIANSKRLLEYQRYREELGLIEASDRLQAEALLQTRKAERETTASNLARQITALNRLMLREADAPMDIRITATITNDIPDQDTALEMAKQNRAELVALKKALEATEARLAEAQDRERMQLDIVAQAGTRGLAETSSKAAARGFGINDRFIFLGLEFQDTVFNNASKAEIQRAILQRQQVLLEQRQSIERIKDEIAQALTLLKYGQKVFQAALARQKAEESKFRAELKRYREGRSSTPTLIKFEDDLHIARLNTSLKRIALQQAYRQLQWAQGTLLRNPAIQAGSLPKKL